MTELPDLFDDAALVRKRRSSRAWHERNREVSRARARQWREDNPGHSREYYRRYKQQRGAKQKLRARWAVQRALRRGELARPDACEVCGAPGHVQAHHRDYRRPLLVTWACRRCHGMGHRQW